MWEPRDPTRVFELLRRLGHAGTENEIAKRVIAAAAGAGVRADKVAAHLPCSAPIRSAEWRRNRASIVSMIVGCITRVGRLAVLMPDAGVVPCGPDGDSVVPGTADGEGEGIPLRYDWIYSEGVRVTVDGDETTVRYPPSWGRVRVEREGMRPAVVALDDIDDDAGRRALVSTRVRRRHELHARCALRGCGRAFRGWLDANTLMIENTRGETMCGLGELAHKKCDLHDDGTAR